MRSSVLIMTMLMFLAACATITPYEEIRAGRFSGSVIVVWVGEGGPNGDGLFVYVPDPNDPLTFTRHPSKSISNVISPGMMYTDGGSIPSFAQGFNGFSPWGYAPAYMIHDWLFTARHCLLDGATDPEYQPLANVTFQDSAEILGEAIKTLVVQNRVKKNDFAGNTITGAVASVVARDLWDKKGACKQPRVSEADSRRALAAISGPESMTPRSQNISQRTTVAASRRSPEALNVSPSPTAKANTSVPRTSETRSGASKPRVVNRVSF